MKGGRRMRDGRKSANRIGRWAAIAGGALIAAGLLVACTQFFHQPGPRAYSANAVMAAVAPETLAEVKEFCETRGGVHIYETADEVEGIIDDSNAGCTVLVCQSLLRDEGYRYVEARSAGFYLNGLTNGPGLYRFSLQPVGHPACGPYEKWIGERGIKRNPPSDDKRPGHYDRYCIASEPIPAFTAQYKYKHSYPTYPEQRGEDFLRRSFTTITRVNGQLMAEQQDYAVSVKGKFAGRHVTCLDFGRSQNLRTHDVLKPKIDPFFFTLWDIYAYRWRHMEGMIPPDLRQQLDDNEKRWRR